MRYRSGIIQTSRPEIRRWNPPGDLCLKPQFADGSYDDGFICRVVGAIFCLKRKIMTPLQLLLIGCGGFIGALARYLVGVAVQSRFPLSTFPWGTFVINITGSLILGLVATLLAERVLSNPNWRPFVTIGFVGAYTTFSTFEYESLQLGSSWQALLNMTGSVVAGYCAVWLGSHLARAIAGHVAARATH
jgi:fluoride exporter